jgi:molecular chaperone DnaJ
MEDYYSILGVQSDACFQEIAIAFRKLALTYHPEKHTKNLAQTNYRFCQVCEAFEVLSTSKSFPKF